MKESGIEWIGQIPEGWDTSRIKNILQERNEKNDPIKSDFILSLTMDKGVIPYNEKKSGGNKAKEDLSAYKLAYPNDIVLNSMNVIAGSVGLSKYFGCVSPVYYMLYPKHNKYSVYYYNYVFQSKAFQQSLIGLGNGILIKQSSTSGKLNTIRMRIPINKLQNVIVPIPPLKEQDKIVKFLDEKTEQIDLVIKKTAKSIEELKRYKESLISETITTGIERNSKVKNSGVDYIGLIPEDWSVTKLRYLGTLQNGISKSGEYFGEGYPFVSYSDVYKNIELPVKVDGLVRSTESERESYSVKYGDVFFTRTSETIEEVGFSSTCLKEIKDAVFAGFVIRFRPFDNRLNPNFAKYYFRSNIHRSFFVKEMNLVTRASLSQELLKNLPVLIPPLTEQVIIAEFLDNKCKHIDNLVIRKEQLILELEDYKKSLIYEYVTGKKEIV